MRIARAVAWLTWEALSVGVRWRPSLVTVIVTHLVTQGSRALQANEGYSDHPIEMKANYR